MSEKQTTIRYCVNVCTGNNYFHIDEKIFLG